VTRCFATFVAGDRNDFFPMDVSCNFPHKLNERISEMKKVFLRCVIDLLTLSSISSAQPQWRQVLPTDVRATAVWANQATVVAGCWATGGTSDVSIMRSTDDGTSWTTVYNLQYLDTNPYFYSFANVGQTIVGICGEGIFCSSDNGAIWTRSDTANLIHYGNANALISNGNAFFVGTFTGYVYSSKDGMNWSPTQLNFSSRVTSFAVNGSDLYVGTSNGGVVRSSDGGASFSVVGLNNAYALGYVGNTLIVEGANGVEGRYTTTDNGENWTFQKNLGFSATMFLTLGQTIFSGTTSGPCILNTYDSLWTETQLGVLTEMSGGMCLAASADKLFAGGNEPSMAGLWETPLSPLGIEIKINALPSKFLLNQNYPNPFNPSTAISYRLPTNTLVVLRVFDVLGREVETLVNERQNLGSHSVTFDASNLSSGVYFYRLEAGTYSATKKLLLLK